MKNRGPAICGVEKAFTTISIHAQPTGKPCPTVEILDETGEANARLIVAAPALLEALKRLKRQVTELLIPALNLIPAGKGSGVDFPTMLEWEKTVEMVDAAIASAEGNQPEQQPTYGDGPMIQERPRPDEPDSPKTRKKLPRQLYNDDGCY